MPKMFDKTEVYRYDDDGGLVRLCEHTAFYGYPMDNDDDCEYIIRITMRCSICQQNFVIRVAIN